MAHPCTQYAQDVVEGRRVAGHSEFLACWRHLEDLQRQGTDGFPWVFDAERADRVYEFIGYCRHVEGELAGSPIILAPFQKFDIGVIFGWVRAETGERRYKKAYIQMARKNGKTALLAAVSLYLMVGDGEMSPRVYCAAVDRGQARLMYDAARVMAENSPDIAKRLSIRDYKISHKRRGGIMAPLSKDTKNKDGLHPSGSIVDEYHAHPTSEIYDVLSSAKGGHRKQPLMVIITTAGMDVQSPCHREYDYCKQILTGKALNDRYFVMIRELDEGDDEHNPALWVKSNPLRVLIPKSLEELREQHDEAFGSEDPYKIREFRVKNLNIWVHGNEDNYMGDLFEKWDGLGVPRKKFLELVKGRPCLVGADLSKNTDLTADGFVFLLDDGRVAVTATGFIPEETLERHEKTDKIPYRSWIRARWIVATDGNVTDYHRIRDHIVQCEVEHEWKVLLFAFDPYNATHFATEMMDDGYKTAEIRNTMPTLNEPTKLFRELVASGRLLHDGSPALKWCVGNAEQIVDSKENVMITKKNASSTKRVDLLTAIIVALKKFDMLKDATSLEEDIKSGKFGF